MKGAKTMTKSELLEMIGTPDRYEETIDAILAMIKPAFVEAAIRLYQKPGTEPNPKK